MSFSLGKAPSPSTQVISELCAESGRHMRFGERMSLSQLSPPKDGSAVDRALSAIDSLDSSSDRHTLQSHYRDLQAAFAALGDRERVVVSAFTDRALRLISGREAPEHVQRRYLWGIVATGAEDATVSLFRIVSDPTLRTPPAVLLDAALALSCHRAPTSRALVLRALQALDRAGRPAEQSEAIIAGLASGVVLRTAHLISTAIATGEFPRNDAHPKGRFHHVALMKEMVAQGTCPALRHKVLEELGSMTQPLYQWKHPLMPATFNIATMLRMPPFVIDVVRLGINHLDPRTQRKAVQTLLPTYRDGSGGEGELVKEILAHRIGGVAAREEVEEFLQHFPISYVRGVKSEARRRRLAGDSVGGASSSTSTESGR